MRKILQMLLVVFLLLTFVSCEQTITSENMGEPTEDTLTTTDDYMETTLSHTSTTMPSSEAPLPLTTEPALSTPTVPFMDEFESFLQLGNYDMFENKTLTLIPEQRYTLFPTMWFFEIVDIHGFTGDYTIYSVKITEVYGYDPFVRDGIYRMAWLGTASQQMYGRPPLEIGKTYVRVCDFLRRPIPTTKLLQAGVIYDVREIDGARYLYGYGVDFSMMDCKIEITDPEENCPYQKGKHDKAIAYLESIGQPLPSFEYKCEVDAFWREHEQRCS